VYLKLVTSAIKIKSSPRDFRVEEQISLPLQARGPYGLYRLWKKELTTVQALGRLSRHCGVPEGEIRYGGKKDRHAETVQFVTVPSSRNVTYKAEDLQCDFWGYAEEPMGPRWIRNNRFRLVLRGIASLREAQDLCGKAKSISLRGMPNYYDDQRFGSQGSSSEFFAEKLLHQNPSEALRLYFTETHPEAPARVRRRNAMISRYWGDWRKIYPFCKKGIHRKILAVLRRDSSLQGFWEALNLLPREELGLYLSAFQSFLWNCLLEKHLFPEETKKEKLVLFCGPWQFAGAFSGENVFSEPCMIPSHAAEVPAMEKKLERLWMEVLEECSLSPEAFALPELRKAYFGSFLRPSVIFPEDVEGEAEPEESGETFKITLSFALPRGSYATLFIKMLAIL